MEGVFHEEDRAFWKRCTFLTDVLSAVERKGIGVAALTRHPLVLSKFMKHPCVVKKKNNKKLFSCWFPLYSAFFRLQEV